MNEGFYKNIDENFESAVELSEKNFSHDDLMQLLQNGNIPQKQIAALKLDCVENKTEGKILVDNLTGCDGKIREAAALKINQLLIKENNNLNKFLYPEIFADATIDINANICRLVVDSVSILKQNKEFSKIYLNKILNFISETFEELDKFIFRDKKYVINKQLFKLYWCLETLKNFTSEIDESLLLKILERASQEKEYTIREKAAQILVNLTNPDFENLKSRLINDENYYVREVFRIKT